MQDHSQLGSSSVPSPLRPHAAASGERRGNEVVSLSPPPGASRPKQPVAYLRGGDGQPRRPRRSATTGGPRLLN